MTDSRFRSLVKAVSWRFVGSIDTLAVSWILTGRFKMAAGIASVEFFTKILLYWLHERAWVSIP